MHDTSSGIFNYFTVLAYMVSDCGALFADAKPDSKEAYTGGKDAKPGGEA